MNERAQGCEGTEPYGFPHSRSCSAECLPSITLVNLLRWSEEVIPTSCSSSSSIHASNSPSMCSYINGDGVMGLCLNCIYTVSNKHSTNRKHVALSHFLFKTCCTLANKYFELKNSWGAPNSNYLLAMG